MQPSKKILTGGKRMQSGSRIPIIIFTNNIHEDNDACQYSLLSSLIMDDIWAGNTEPFRSKGGRCQAAFLVFYPSVMDTNLIFCQFSGDRVERGDSVLLNTKCDCRQIFDRLIYDRSKVVLENFRLAFDAASLSMLAKP
jgi:hypothetical protein